MSATPTSPQRSNTFGIIALVISILLFFTPKILLSLVLVAWAIFTILGLFRDRLKVFSGIALVIGGLVFVALFQDAQLSEKSYTVQYAVTCYDCDVSYTNETGGSDEEVAHGYWTKVVTMKGDEFIHLSAQGNSGNTSVTSAISVDGKELSTETSRGEFSIASVSGQARDINSK